MRKRVLSFVLSAALIANPFLSVQTAKAETNTSAIPVKLVKKVETGTGEEEDGTYQSNSSKGKIESIDIKKPERSKYLDKAYYQTELDGKVVKSLQWLDAGQELIKYELANEPTLPQNVDLYYKKGEQTAKANYYFTGGKADVSFTLTGSTSDRVDVVNENGVALTNEEVYIAEEKNNEEEYTFLVQTKTGKRDTKITVKMQEDATPEQVLTPSDNLSTVSQITLKYVVKVKRGSTYKFTVEGVENNGTPSFTLKQMECTKINGSDLDNWFYYNSDTQKVFMKAHGSDCILSEKVNTENAVLFSQETLENGSIEATFTLNTYNKRNNNVYNYLVDCIAIADEFVQVPAPPIAYCHTIDDKDEHWNIKLKSFIDSTENKAVITKFTTGKLAGSTVKVKITKLVVPNDPSAINAVGLVYTVIMEKPPKEEIPINIRTREMSQGFIAKASTRGIKDLELYCNNKDIWTPYNNADGPEWKQWAHPDNISVHWVSPLAKSIMGNMTELFGTYDMRGRGDKKSPYKEDVDEGTGITTSDQKFNVRFLVEDGYVNPKVVYDHQELNIKTNKPVNMQYSSESSDSSKKLEISNNKETQNKYEVKGLTAPRYGMECNTEPDPNKTAGTKVFVGNLSSLLFEVELLELPVKLDEQNDTGEKDVGTMNVQSRKTLQIPDTIPQKQGQYFTGYKLCKVVGDSEFPSSKYYYPGQTITLKDDVGPFAVNGKKLIDKVVLKAVYGEENTDTANKVVVKTILKKLDDSTEVYDQKVFSAAKNTYVRVKSVTDKITKGSEFKFVEAFSQLDKTPMTKVETTNVTRAGDVTPNSGFSLDGKVTADGQVFEIIYMEEEGQKLELFNAGTTDKVPNDTVVAGSEVKVNLTLKKIGDMPETIQVKVPGKDEFVTLTKKVGSDNDEKVVYEADNILVTKAETGTVTISDKDKVKIHEVEKITNPPLTVVAGKPSSQTSTIKVSPSAIAITGSSIGTVELKDAYGNPIKDANPIVKVDGKDLPVDSVITNKGNGIYEFPYTPDSVGNKLFELMDDNNQVVGNDTLTVESGAGTISITKGGQPVDKTPVHEEITITVTVEDNGTNPPNEIKVTVPGVDGEVTLTRQPDGTYTGTATPTKPATGEVTIVDEGYKNITPKPITVTAGKPDSANSTITVSPNPVLVGDKVTGTVELKDKDGNPVTGVTPEITVDGKVIPIPDGGIKELGDGKYEFTFTPDTVGNKTVGVSVDKDPVVDTPLKVKDVDGVITVTKDGKPIESGKVIPQDKIDITVELKDPEGETPSEIKVTVPGVEGEVTLTKQPDGTYKGSATPTKPATGNITVVDSKYPNIKPVPITVEVGEVDNNNSSLVVNPNPPVVGETVNGNLSLKDKNGNPITGKNPEISVDGTPVTNVTEKNDGEYTFTYVPNKEGTSTITVVVDGKEGPKYTLQVVNPSVPNRVTSTIPLIDSTTNNQGGTSTIPEKEEKPSKPSKQSISTEKEDVSKPSKKPTTNKKDTVTEEKEEPKVPKKEDDNQGVKEFNRIPEKSSNDTNIVTNNIGKPIEYANWYYDTLDTKDNTFITTNGLEALEQLPKGTQIGEIQGVNYNKLGLQKGFVRAVLPDGTMKRVPVEVAVLSNAQVKLKGLRSGDIYVIGKTLGVNETGKTQGKTQGSGLVQAIVPKTGERSMLGIFMMLLVSGVVIAFTFRRRKQNN